MKETTFVNNPVSKLPNKSADSICTRQNAVTKVSYTLRKMKDSIYMNCNENSSVLNCNLVQGKRSYENINESYSHTNQNLLKFSIIINNIGLINMIFSAEQQIFHRNIFYYSSIYGKFCFYFCLIY